jgi:hypothetical protein
MSLSLPHVCPECGHSLQATVPQGRRDKSRKRPGFNKTTIELICSRLIQGMSMSQACAPPDVPSAAPVYLRMARDEEFARIIARARQAQQDALADSTQDLADGMTAENWQHRQAQIRAIQWRAGKLNALRYGNKTLHVGGDGKGPVEIEIKRYPGQPDRVTAQELTVLKRLYEKYFGLDLADEARVRMVEGEAEEEE